MERLSQDYRPRGPSNVRSWLLLAVVFSLGTPGCGKEKECPVLCSQPSCIQAGDCAKLPLSHDCRGHWECIQGDCLRTCDAYRCTVADDCIKRPSTSLCHGDWSCEGGECVPVCSGTPCAADGDCSALPWTKGCPGAWQCQNGQCTEVCESGTCDDASDCRHLPWPGLCTGAWECLQSACTTVCDTVDCDDKIPFHPPVLDQEGKLLPWTSFDRVIRLAMGFVAFSPEDEITGLPWYLQYCSFHYQTMEPDSWPHNPAGLFGMMVETLRRFYPYTGERKWIDFVRRPLDKLIAESTPATFLWPRVPYSSADNSGHYRGGSSEGEDGIEPDKVAQAAVGYLRFFQVTGEWEYLYQAVHCANTLAARIRPGDEGHSPWPFRLNAKTGDAIEEYTSEVLWPVALFDDLSRLGLSTPAQELARNQAWAWLMRFPMKNAVWKGYFEDVFIDSDNMNRDQYTPGEVARYLMTHKETDDRMAEHVPALLSWIKDSLGDTGAPFFGATGIQEQYLWPKVAGSHTARYASLCAMWSALGGGEDFRQEALRSLALASYFAREDGIVIFSSCDRGVWFTDGYFDYVPHFLDTMAALPELAPGGEDHLLGSSSIVTDIAYATGKIEYRTFDPVGEETLKISFTPSRITAEGRKLSEVAEGAAGEGFRFDPSTGVLRIIRQGTKEVLILSE